MPFAYFPCVFRSHVFNSTTANKSLQKLRTPQNYSKLFFVFGSLEELPKSQSAIASRIHTYVSSQNMS